MNDAPSICPPQLTELLTRLGIIFYLIAFPFGKKQIIYYSIIFIVLYSNERLTPMKKPIFQSDIKEYPLFRRGKVRDVYDMNDKLLIVASDRISAFDVVMPRAIPEKGIILNQMSLFWFNFIKDIVKNHLLVTKFVFFFNDTATTEIYTLSLHDALPIWRIDSGRTPAIASRRRALGASPCPRSEEHTSELQSLTNLVCRLLLEKKKR